MGRRLPRGIQVGPDRRAYGRDLECWFAFCAAHQLHAFRGVRRTHLELYLRELETYRDDLVFTHADGSLIHPQRLSRWFRQHCEAAGLPRIRLHDVRHTYASAGLAAATGWHEVKVISERLGHASVGITLDTYSHVLPSADENTAHTLARVILGQ